MVLMVMWNPREPEKPTSSNALPLTWHLTGTRPLQEEIELPGALPKLLC